MDFELCLRNYRYHLLTDEKAISTTDKYCADVKAFIEWMGERSITKELVVLYKNEITERYKTSSVNSKIAAVNSFLSFLGMDNCKVKPLRMQRQLFVKDSLVLTIEDYLKLKEAAKGTKISHVMETIVCTGIRISELRYITVEAVKMGYTSISCKGKNREILIPDMLRMRLLKYIAGSEIKSGPIFITANGNPLDRSNVWRDMKKLCITAGILEEKVFPHNLRHLFARTFYETSNDIVKLADVLGHSNINTTRIYTIESEKKHLSVLNKIENLMIT